MNDLHFWVKHCLQLSAALLQSSSLARLYTPQQITYLQWFHDAKWRAYVALEAGEAMDPYTQVVADYLLAYADAHVRWYHPHTTNEFEAAMLEARVQLADGFNTIQAAHDAMEVA